LYETTLPFPTKKGEQELKPLSASGRGLERGLDFPNIISGKLGKNTII